jgi:signal transduction histidine kinase/CHASE3 domain sensor protein
VAGFAAAFFALAVIGVLSYRSTQQLLDSYGQVTHTLDVLATGESLLSLLKDAETGQRGYLLVREPNYLEPYQAATQKIRPVLERLRELTRDNPGQQERIGRIEVLVRDKLEELARTIALDRAGSRDAALEVVQTGQGKRVMDMLRLLLAEVEAEERRLLEERTERLHQVTVRTLAVVLGGTGLLGVLTLLAAGMTARDFRALARARREHRRYEQRLEALHAIDKAILQAASPVEIIQAALSALRQVVGCEQAGLLLFEPGQEQARVLISEEGLDTQVDQRLPLPSPPRMEVPEGNGGAILDLGVVPAPAHGLPTLPRFLERGLRYQVILPVGSGTQPVGSLILASQRQEAFDEVAVQIAREVAAQVSIALEQARLREVLRGEAERLERQVRERTAELRETNAELEAFSYSVSHDLRGPLRAIDGFSQAIEDDPDNVLTARSQRFFGKVKAASGRMAGLIDDLLNLSHVSRTEMARSRVDLTALAGQVIAELRAREPQRQVEVSIQEGLVGQGDPRLLRIVLDNLLGNAWKFTGHQPHPRIEVSAFEQQGETVFSIRDNGAGFDMAYAQKLFSPFQRMHSDQEFPGTGIGLAIVFRILRRHAGRIWAESTVGSGATFYFTLGGSDVQ